MIKKIHKLTMPVLVTAIGVSVSYASAYEGSKKVSYQGTGETTTCINASDIDTIFALDDETLIVQVSPSRYYRNKVTKGCKRATSPFRRFQYDVRAASLCRGETIKMVDNGDNITTGFCQLGEFEKVTRVK